MQTLFRILKEEMPKQSKIIITHNLDLAYKLGFDVLFMEDGYIKYHGASKDFFEQSHLDILYEGSVLKQANNIVVKL